MPTSKILPKNILTVSKARRNRVREAWLGLPETWRTELMSAFHTFVPAFVGVLAVSFQATGNVSWTRDAIIAVFLAAFRAGFKAVSMWFFSRVLPDPKEKKAAK